MMFEEVIERQDRVLKSMGSRPEAKEQDDPDINPVEAFMSGLKFDDQERPQGAFGSPIITMHVLGEEAEQTDRMPAASLQTIEEETDERPTSKEDADVTASTNTASHVRKRKKASQNTDDRASLSS